MSDDRQPDEVRWTPRAGQPVCENEMCKHERVHHALVKNVAHKCLLCDCRGFKTNGQREVRNRAEINT